MTSGLTSAERRPAIVRRDQCEEAPAALGGMAPVAVRLPAELDAWADGRTGFQKETEAEMEWTNPERH